jgi:hypothetical protein
MHGATHIYDNGDSSIERVRALASELRADWRRVPDQPPGGRVGELPRDADWKYFRDGGYDGDVVPDLSRC